MKRVLRLIVAVATVAVACGSGGERVVVAAGTTLVDSGILDELARVYEEENPGIDVSVAARATREALELGARGAVDVTITHAPEQEQAFLVAHPEAEAREVFSSRFLLAGPAERSVVLGGLSIEEALRRVAAEGWAFVTRADGSGTYDRERTLWASAGVEPDGAAWYVETGQGMGNSLQVADQRRAFILVEEGTYLNASDRIELRPVELAGSGAADNPYTAIVVTPAGAAADFADWLISSEGQAALADANEAIFGRVVYAP